MHTLIHTYTAMYTSTYMYHEELKKKKQNEEEVVNFDVCLGDKVLPVSIVNNQSPLLSTVFIVEVIMMMS